MKPPRRSGLLECIDVLVKRVGYERVNAWKELISAGGDWDAFVQDILEEPLRRRVRRPQRLGLDRKRSEKATPLFLDDTYETMRHTSRAAIELMREV